MPRSRNYGFRGALHAAIFLLVFCRALPHDAFPAVCRAQVFFLAFVVLCRLPSRVVCADLCRLPAVCVVRLHISGPVVCRSRPYFCRCMSVASSGGLTQFLCRQRNCVSRGQVKEATDIHLQTQRPNHPPCGGGWGLPMSVSSHPPRGVRLSGGGVISLALGVASSCPSFLFLRSSGPSTLCFPATIRGGIRVYVSL